MNKIIPQKLKSIKSSMSFVEEIFPFTEKPSNEHLVQQEKANKDVIQACDLFSLFTADIIKEHVVFTR
jgi:hypothetical protein